MSDVFIRTVCGVLFLCAISTSWADDPKVGETINGGTFIYRDDIEGLYWVDWVAYPLMDKKKLKNSDAIHMTMVAEGKNTFIGSGNIYCSSGESDWEIGSHDGNIIINEYEIKEYIPEQAIKNSIAQLCTK